MASGAGIAGRPNRRRPRLVVLAVALGLVLAACGGGSSESATSSEPPAAAEATETPAAAEPTAETASEPDPSPTPAPEPTATAVPEDGRTIIALDEQVAFALLSLGIEPDNVLTTLSSETFAALNAQLGLETTEFVIAEPSFELLAGFAPDLIVGIANPFVVDSIEEYERIATVVLAPLDATWQDQLRAIAVELDAGERAEMVIDAVDALQADTTTALAAAGADGTSVSVMTVRVGNILAVDGGGAIGQLLAGVGLTRPEPQQVSGPPGIPFAFLSEETVGDHDADVLLLPRAGIFDLEPLLESPIYQQLGAVQSGNAYDVVADAWVLGGNAFATYWALQDLQDLLVDGIAPASLDAAEGRWAAFLDRIR